jgi:hypothetical protein
MTLRLILTLSLALVPFAASAAPAAKKAADARASEPAPSRVYDFDPDDVEGESLRPEGTDVGTRPPGPPREHDQGARALHPAAAEDRHRHLSAAGWPARLADALGWPTRAGPLSWPGGRACGPR